MSLLSFRASVQCAACHRCGNALGKGVHECPHCGALQTALAIRTHSPIDFPNGVPAQMTQRMLVPYPSVPEEVETATNIARQRAQSIRRVVFGVATSTLCAGALVLAVGPSLRAPAGEQRIATLPQRSAAVPEEGPTVTADAALPSHAPGTPGPSDTATAVLSVPPVPVADEFAPTAAAASSAAVVVASTRSPAPTPTVASARSPGLTPTVASTGLRVATPSVASAHLPVATPTVVVATPSPLAKPTVVVATPSPSPTPIVAPAPTLASTSTPVIADEPKAVHNVDDDLYAARLAMIANDLSTARTHLSKVAPTNPVDPEAQRIADELARRESVRDADMQRARACDAANLLPCARRYAKAAMAVDTGYSDSQAFFKRVVYKQAAAKRAAAAALAQAQAAAMPHPAPIRDATPFIHYVSHGNPVEAPSAAVTPTPAPVPSQAPAPIAQRSFASASVRPAPAESHDIREVREVREVREPRVVQEVRPAELPAPAPAPAPVAEATDYSIPIMARGRGVAH
jgi:hypothetical protein